MLIDARAKINLTLNVLGRREDGYHDLELSFQPISLRDTLDIRPKKTPGLDFYCSIRQLMGEDNLVCRAYRAMSERYPQIGGLKISLRKRIPVGAGLGGGSADAAAMILALDEMYELGMTQEEKVAMGASLGADVPACMQTTACVGRGIGDKLEPISTTLTYPLLLMKPPQSFSTAEMYRRIDEAGDLPQRYGTEAVAEALRQGDLTMLCDNVYNVFEEVVPKGQRIDELKGKLLAHGAKAALMTGSGSCVYGIFATEKERNLAYRRLMTSQVFLSCCEAVNEP